MFMSEFSFQNIWTVGTVFQHWFGVRMSEELERVLIQ